MLHVSSNVVVAAHLALAGAHRRCKPRNAEITKIAAVTVNHIVVIVCLESGVVLQLVPLRTDCVPVFSSFCRMVSCTVAASAMSLYE